MAESVLQPFRNPDVAANYDHMSRRQPIQALTRKAGELVSEGQFGHGETLLALETTLQPIPQSWDEMLVRTYPDPHCFAATSGILWHVAFGQPGMDLFRPTEFDGASNLDGQCAGEGILRTENQVRGIVVVNNDKTGAFVRQSDVLSDAGQLAVHVASRWNCEGNQLLCRLPLTPQQRAEWKEMVSIKAVELWYQRDGVLWEADGDWFAARRALGLPDCFQV